MSPAHWIIGTLSAAGALTAAAWLGWIGGQDACRADRDEAERQRGITREARAQADEATDLARVALERCRGR